MENMNDRQREMTDERKARRNRIIKRVAIVTGAAVAAGVGGAIILDLLSPDTVVDTLENVIPLIPDNDWMICGGAMGQWEEIPMTL